MREIKFRAWDKDLKKWSDIAQKYTIEDINCYTDYVWEQYTGLKDKNDIEIYEGDIIRICDTDVESEYIHEVVWGGEEYPGWDVKPYWDSECNVFSDVYNTDYFTIEVIGNIHENSDLLK